MHSIPKVDVPPERIKYFLAHYVLQSRAWVKKGEYACESAEARERMRNDLLRRHPSDLVRFVRWEVAP